MLSSSPVNWREPARRPGLAELHQRRQARLPPLVGGSQQAGDQGALDLYVMIDDTESTGLGSQLEDLRQFVSSQPPYVKVGIAYMQDGTARVVQDLTENHVQAAKALRLPLGVVGINASPYFALDDLVKRWPQDSARHEVLMVTDGLDRSRGAGPSDPYVDTAIEDAQRAGVVVFAIYNPGVGRASTSYWRW